MASFDVDKSEWRETYLSRRSKISDAEHRKISSQVSSHVETLLSSDEFEVIAGYAAVGREIELDNVLFDLADTHRIVLPKVVFDDEMQFFEISDSSDLKTGYRGIREPIPELAPRVELEQIDLYLVPGVAFDREGNRLGRGEGFYDRTLARIKRKKVLRLGAVDCAVGYPTFVGIGYDWQVSRESLPTEEHDVGLDLIVTESGLFVSSNHG